MRHAFLVTMTVAGLAGTMAASRYVLAPLAESDAAKPPHAFGAIQPRLSPAEFKYEAQLAPMI